VNEKIFIFSFPRPSRLAAAFLNASVEGVNNIPEDGFLKRGRGGIFWKIFGRNEVIWHNSLIFIELCVFSISISRVLPSNKLEFHETIITKSNNKFKKYYRTFFKNNVLIFKIKWRIIFKTVEKDNFKPIDFPLCKNYNTIWFLIKITFWNL